MIHKAHIQIYIISQYDSRLQGKVRGPFNNMVITRVIMDWISNYIHDFLWDVITHSRPNFNSGFS